MYSNFNILLVDDEEDILNLIETVLLKEGFEHIIKNSNGMGIPEIIQREKVDLVVLDIMMFEINGFEVAKSIREISNIPIIFLTARTRSEDIIKGFQLGADDYVTKPFSPIELSYRIKANLKNKNVHGNVIQSDDMKLCLSSFKLFIGDIEVDLNPKEFNLLKYFMENKGKIKTKRDIYQEIWSEDILGYDISVDNKIMVHIRNLRKKIEVNPSNPKRIITAKGLGYKFMED